MPKSNPTIDAGFTCGFINGISTNTLAKYLFASFDIVADFIFPFIYFIFL